MGRKKERKEGRRRSLKYTFMYADDTAMVYIKLCLYTLNIRNGLVTKYSVAMTVHERIT